jgi:hypothetical protein
MKKAKPKESKSFFSGKLFLSLILDAIGSATYIIPLVGEGADLIWAPIYSIIIQQMYHRKLFSVLALLEEIGPADVIPSATICYTIEYVKKRKLKAKGK